MSCGQDSYYTQDVPNHAGDHDGCGYCDCNDNESGLCGSGGFHGPDDCPDGQHATGKFQDCGNPTCFYGHRKICNYDQPNMDVTTTINCCLNQNLRNNTPNGYCASGWCKGSANCTSFFNKYCQSGYLNTNECQQFCRANPGVCDKALLSYCATVDPSNPGVCGCALPSNQYVLSKLRGTNGLQIPISCDYRCGVNPNAIRLQGQQDCEIGSICVADIEDVNVTIDEVKNAIGTQGIVIDQNCGSGPYGPPSPTPTNITIIQKISNFIRSPFGIITLILSVLVILALIGMIIWMLTKKNKIKSED